MPVCFGCKIPQLSYLELKGEIWISGHGVEAGKEFFHCCWMGRGLCLAVPTEFPSFLSRSLWSTSWTCKWLSPMFLPPLWSKTKTSSLGNQFISFPNIRQFPTFGIWEGFYLVNKSPQTPHQQQLPGLRFALLASFCNTKTIFSTCCHGISQYGIENAESSL